MQIVRGLFRLLVVGFTVVSLMLVAAVGVSATSGKHGSSDTLKHSVVALFSGHSDQTGGHDGGTGSTDNNKDKEGKDKEGHKCKPPKDDDHEATEGHENNQCGHDDSG